MAEPTVAEQVAAAVEEATAGLAKKNSDMLAELKQAKKVAASFTGVDLAELQARADRATELENARMSDEEKAQVAEKKRKAELEAERARGDKAVAEAKQLRLSQAIDNAIDGAGTAKPTLKDGLRHELQSRTTLSDEGKFMVGDKTLSEFATEFAGGTGIEYFVPPNSGGGAGGGRTGGVSEFGKYFEKGGKDYSMSKQSEIAKSHPEEFARLFGKNP